MKIYQFEGKNEEEIKEKIKKEINQPEENLVIKYKEEESKGLFKTKKIEAKVAIKDEITTFVKEELKKITIMMGMETNIEVKNTKNSTKFVLYSENNSILIGKNGRNLEALQIIIKQMIYNKLGTSINIIIDVEDYKEKQHRNIEYLAKKIAREVRDSKVEAKMTDMNSYERRLVHTVLTDFKGIYTESEGQEPNRYVVIKPKEN